MKKKSIEDLVYAVDSIIHFYLDHPVYFHKRTSVEVCFFSSVSFFTVQISIGSNASYRHVAVYSLRSLLIYNF